MYITELLLTCFGIITKVNYQFDFVSISYSSNMLLKNWTILGWLSTVWAWVDYGHSPSLKKASEVKPDEEHRKIIVSRSHAGPVETVAKKSFGEGTQVVPAGGAGRFYFSSR